MSATEEKLAYLREKIPDAEDSTLLDLLISCDGSTSKVIKLLGLPGCSAPKGVGVQSTLKRFVDPESTSPKKKKRTDIKGQTIHIYNPEQMEALDIPCTMTLNILPRKTADHLFQFLLKETESWTSAKFFLFEREVSSRHQYAQYSEFPERNTSYQGRLTLHSRPFTDEIRTCRDIIVDKVNGELQNRTPGKFQRPGRWNSDFVIANHYPDQTSCVGYHSDQITHIGPDAIIASYTLGVTREFRLRPRYDPTNNSTISIHIPHNCLVIMHAGCQEQYKHSIPPISMAFEPHPIGGQSRINLTYRMYRPEYALEKIPLCQCGLPMILRTTKAKDWRYMWQCSSTYSQAKGCSKVLFPTFTDDDPIGLGSKTVLSQKGKEYGVSPKLEYTA